MVGALSAWSGNSCPQQLHGVVNTGSLIGAVDDVAPDGEIVLAEPVFARE